MKYAVALCILFAGIACKKSYGPPSYGTISYTYHDTVVTAGNAYPIVVLYENGVWNSLQAQFYVYKGVSVLFWPARPYITDTVATGNTYVLGELQNPLMSSPLFYVGAADSAKITFTALANDRASGTFYMRAQTTTASGGIIEDSVTNGTFTNVPVEYRFD